MLRACLGASLCAIAAQIAAGSAALDDDVLPPHRFGLRTVWKPGAAGEAVHGADPFARPLAYPYARGQTVQPDAIILSLDELPGVIERLEVHP